MIKVLLHGAGRMAQGVMRLVLESQEYELAGVVSRSEPVDASGQVIAGINRVSCLDEIAGPIAGNIDIVIDFTLPGGTAKAADWCAINSVAFLSGTTGLGDDDIAAMKKAALLVPVLWAPNLSQGVALICLLVKQAAEALGTQANINIHDVHHKHKIDAPSGTALALAEAVMEGRSEPLEGLLEEHSLAGMADSKEGELGFSSIRQGEVIGEHTVSFTMPNELIEITHKALNRDVFAGGALKAGAWLFEQPAGYYTTEDWLLLPAE